MEDLYELLTDEERGVVEGEGDRLWPDLWDAHQSSSSSAARLLR